MVTYKYFIVLYCNRKKKKTLHKSAKRSTIMNAWQDYKTQTQPKYVKTNTGKKRTQTKYELALIYPVNRWSKDSKTYGKDEFGRNIELKMSNPKQRIKQIIPYWCEELIYDFDAKTRIRYHELMLYINTITDIAQIFTLNNKLLVQVEDNIKMFGNKNIADTIRLFEIVRDDLLGKDKKNFIFVRDVTRHQRLLLYDLLESKGYKRSELVKHYSY